MFRWLQRPLIKGASITYKRAIITSASIVGTFYGVAYIKKITHVDVTVKNVFVAIALCTFINYVVAIIEVIINRMNNKTDRK